MNDHHILDSRRRDKRVGVHGVDALCSVHHMDQVTNLTSVSSKGIGFRIPCNLSIGAVHEFKFPYFRRSIKFKAIVKHVERSSSGGFTGGALVQLKDYREEREWASFLTSCNYR